MKVNFVGDIGLFKKFEDYSIDPFKIIQLPESDLNIGNFEFIIPKIKNKFFYDVQDKYSCSYEYFKSLEFNRFRGLGLANNHSNDYGFNGAQETIEVLTEKGVKVFGYSDNLGYSIGSFEVKGIKVAILAFVKKGRWSKEVLGFGPDSYDTDKVCETIKELKSDYNHIIIYPHWGTELIEVPDQLDTFNAKKFVDAGASAVIGHHPHVSQGIEKYKNGVIAYSLGSFMFMPEEVLGYTKKSYNQEISICLNIEFSTEKILNFTTFYYRYNRKKFIPEQIIPQELDEYASFLNTNIYNSKLFQSQVRNVLLKREVISFIQRFKTSPFKTLVNYFKLLKFKHIKKIFLKS
jgi:hypothetical protein